MFDAIAESLPKLQPWMPWAKTHHTVEDSLEYIRQCQVRFLLRTDYAMGIFHRADNRYLGGTGLHVREQSVPSFEIGYWIRATAEGKGYVSETVQLLTICAFDTLQAERVAIKCDARNTRSLRVAERQGYVYEGRHRNVQRDPTGALSDMLTYAMTRTDFERARQLWNDPRA